MRIVLSLLLALAAATTARADIVLEQKAEGPMLNARMTLKVKGHLARTDTVSANSSTTVLMDIKAERMMVVMHDKKLIVEKDMKAVRQQMEAAQKAAGLDPSAVGAPKATGTIEKVGDWNAEIYEFTLGDLPGKVWVAKDFPNGQALREELKKVTAANNGGFDPNKLDVPGMIVKYQLSTQAGLITSTLIKAAEEPVADTEFVLPRGYSEMAMPPISSGVPK
jgi:hypothetical protein